MNKDSKTLFNERKLPDSNFIRPTNFLNFIYNFDLDPYLKSNTACLTCNVPGCNTAYGYPISQMHFKKHVIEKHLGIQYNCKICNDGRIFKNITSLRKHITLDHLNFDPRMDGFKLEFKTWGDLYDY
jgi:hypothetical protein